MHNLTREVNHVPDFEKAPLSHHCNYSTAQVQTHNLSINWGEADSEATSIYVWFWKLCYKNHITSIVKVMLLATVFIYTQIQLDVPGLNDLPNLRDKLICFVF
jgi:hypothetical protein